MPRYTATNTIGHSAEQMFDLVADIERYPEFVPLCTAMQVIDRGQEGNAEILTARMTVASGFVKETFINRVTLDRPAMTISVVATDGPFKQLENRWSFEPIGDKSCRIDFILDYEFKSLPLRILLGAISDSAFSRYEKAFEDRADALYGTNEV